MSDNYHHGNLRHALIDAGIKIVNESGEANLSLRKVAALCKVSHTAPYAHFANKDYLIRAIKARITDEFTERLSSAVNNSKNAKQALINMGKNYVSFFIQRPDYFKFLFGSQNITAHTRTDNSDDYPPFILLKKTYRNYLAENKISKTEDEQEVELIKLWASAHGLAAIACMTGVETSFDWSEKIQSDQLIK